MDDTNFQNDQSEDQKSSAANDLTSAGNQQNRQEDEHNENSAQKGNGQQTAGSSQTSGTGQTTDEDYAILQAELEQTQGKLQEMMVMSQRALADLQNYKRRAEEEKSSFMMYANAELLMDLLPAVDNINRALAHEPKDTEWANGVSQTLKQLSQVLEKRNVKTIPTIGEKFDPKLHEALLAGPGEKDVVLEEFEKGYLLGDRVIKPARVRVGNGEIEMPNIPTE